MSYIGQAPGLGQRSVFRFVALQGQTVFSGRDAAGLVMAYAVGTSTLVAVNGRLLSGPDYTATDGSTLTIAAPLSAGDEVIVVSDAPFSPANTYTTDAANTRFTRKRNRIVNPGMRISQEKGASVQAMQANSAFFYAVDGFTVHGAQTATLSAAQVAGPVPGSYRLALTVTAGAAMAQPSDSCVIITRLEGLDISDLLWGTAAAKPASLRFAVTAPAGTYHVAIRNDNNSRSYVAAYTVLPGEANVEKVVALTIPGDTVGPWSTGTGIGLTVTWVLLSTLVGSAGSWQNGSFHAGAAQTNTFGTTTGNTFKLGDVGLYEGAVPPIFELPNYNDDLMKCQRYFQWMPTLVGNWDTSTRYNGAASFPTPMRVAPTVSFVSSGQGVTRAYVGDYPVSGVFFSETTTTTIIAALTTASADPNYVGFTKGNLKVALNARL